MFKKHLFLFISLFLLSMFFIVGNSGLDPDFGWHLATGNLLISQGMPMTDPFSYSMPHYQFIEFELLPSLGIGYLYPYIGLDGLAVICALIAFLAFFLQTTFLKRKFVLVPFFLAGVTLIPFLGIRPQVFSWLFVSLLLLLFFKEKLWQQLRFIVPVVMILWVNTHGSFPLGIFLIGFIVLVKQLQKKKLLLADWLVFMAAVGATLLSPYGLRAWWEVWFVVSDSSLRWVIQEWLPAFFFFNVGLLFFLPLSAALMIYSRKIFTTAELVLYCCLLFFALSSARHLPFWLLIAIPMTARAIEHFLWKIRKIPFAQRRLKITVMSFAGAFVVLFAGDMALHLRWDASRFAAYPDKAIVFLQQHPVKGNLFSLYNWGGHLIWKYPEKKVFVDGRMPTWKTESAPARASSNAFGEYQIIVSGQIDPQPFFEKYAITTVMIGAKEDRVMPGWLHTGVEKILKVKLPDSAAFKQQLSKAGWKAVYKDELAVIYQKED